MKALYKAGAHAGFELVDRPEPVTGPGELLHLSAAGGDEVARARLDEVRASLLFAHQAGECAG